ncbi:endonuclease [Thermoplasma volcanium GSS1]|uniref:Endonuclease n=1 Tax=Thermoplasma volcanium (strain ATCC 51530 / DSM 4299 / JCM 9571 / NBRC 15438 / GSS1) TaxID=273116 RepID=Q97AI3_THEVO|nr:phosphatidylserine/phosphatidylglycerophosphate/cardiolipin synthase family protein [Thermoplasma volcanium]BAB59969.1 endonuclease [Thermoplasma volcanium GSS1]
MTIYVEPQDGIVPIIKFIRRVRKKIFMNFYLIDDDRIINEIREAKKRGVDVRIIVDGKPYGMGQSKVDVKELSSTCASVKLSPPRFDASDVFDHAKYMVSEKYFEIGTANMTEASFSRNREYIYIGKNRKIRKCLMSLFISDWENSNETGIRCKELVISPGSESTILHILRTSKLVESEEVGDDTRIIETLSSRRRKLKIVIPSSASQNDIANMKKLRERGVKARLMPPDRLYMHAKAVLFKDYVFIGSQNFTSTSLNRNREVGIIIRSLSDRRKIKRIMVADWKRSEKI